MNYQIRGRQGARQARPRGITVVALLMILFGLAEIMTGFTHSFLGISTAETLAFTLAAAAVGSFYIGSGLLVLAMKKWAAGLAIVLLVADILGRIALVVTGLYPLNTAEQVIAIVIGTAIAGLFAVYIGFKWELFS